MSASAPVSLWARSAHDTTADAARLQVEAWRRLGASERVRVALDLSDAVRAVALEGARSRGDEAALTDRFPSAYDP